MARISTGQTYGTTTRQTSPRLLGAEEVQSLSGALDVRPINAPAISPQANPVNTFVQAGAPTLGGAVIVPRPPDVPAPNGDLERLAESLGNFSPVLRQVGEVYLNQQKDLDKKRQQEGAEFAMQVQRTVGAYTGLADAQRRLERKAAEGDQGAQRLLQYMLSRHPGMFAYLAESTQENALLMGAARLPSLVRNSESELRGLTPDDPRFAAFIQQNLISDEVVSPRVMAKHQQLLISAQNSAREIHEQQHIGHKVDMWKADQAIKTGGLAQGYIQGVLEPARVAGIFQEMLDNAQFLGLPEKERRQLAMELVKNWNAALRMVTPPGEEGVTTEQALAPFAYLMVGPVDQRVLADGSRNEKLSFINYMGGPEWLESAYGEFETIRLQQYNRAEQIAGIGTKAYTNDLIGQLLTPEVMGNPSLAEQARQQGLMQIESQFARDPIQKAAARAQFDTAWTNSFTAYNEQAIKNREFEYSVQMQQAEGNPALLQQLRRRIEEDGRSGIVGKDWATSALGQLSTIQNRDNRPLLEMLGDLSDAQLEKWDQLSKDPNSYGSSTINDFEIAARSRARAQMKEEGWRVIREGRAAGKNDMQIQDDLQELFKRSNWGLKQRQLPTSQTQAYPTLKDMHSKNKGGWLTNAIPPDRANYLKSQARARALFGVEDLERELDAITGGGEMSNEMKETLRALTTGPNKMTPSEFFIKQLRFHGLDIDAEHMQKIKALDKGQKVSSAPASERPQVAAADNPYLDMLANVGSRVATGPLGLLAAPAQARGINPFTGSRFDAPAVAIVRSFERPASVVYEGAGGQPGVDYWFPSKQFPAVLSGRVKDVRREPGYGNFVVIESIDPRNGQKVDVLYGHLADGGINVRPGQTVQAGQIIGKQGGTGRVRSADGTIASVDFLAPAPAGSGSMAPYRDYDGLRRWVTSRLQRGGR